MVGRDAEAQASTDVVTVRGNNLEVASSFKYLSSMLTKNFTSDNTLQSSVTTSITVCHSKGLPGGGELGSFRQLHL